MFELGATLDVVTDRRRLLEVLELAEMDILDGSGLGISVGSAQRLVPVAEQRSNRSPSMKVTHTLDVAVRPGWLPSSNPFPPLTTSARSSPFSPPLLNEVTVMLADDDVLDSGGSASGSRRWTGPR